jgi:hypothetical protein
MLQMKTVLKSVDAANFDESAGKNATDVTTSS